MTPSLRGVGCGTTRHAAWPAMDLASQCTEAQESVSVSFFFWGGGGKEGGVFGWVET